MDVTKLRYRDWDDLMNYCTYSAMPVGRFVLDVHGEDRATWPANDALCAALQIINHLQDCQADYRNLDRVYVPLDALRGDRRIGRRSGAARSSPALRACLRSLATRTGGLLDESRAVLRPHSRFPPGAGGLRHPDAGAPSRGDARRARSAERARAPEDHGRRGARRRSAWPAGAAGRVRRMLSPSHNNPRDA